MLQHLGGLGSLKWDESRLLISMIHLGGATLLSHTHKWWMPTIFPGLVCLHSLILWHKAYTNRFECFQFHQLISLLSGFDMDGFHRLHVNFQHPFLKMYGLMVQKVPSPTNEDSCSCSAKKMFHRAERWVVVEKHVIQIRMISRSGKNWVDRNFRNLDVVVLLIFLSPQTNHQTCVLRWYYCLSKRRKAGTPQIHDFQWFSSTSDTSLKHHLSDLSWEMLGALGGVGSQNVWMIGAQPSVISNA